MASSRIEELEISEEAEAIAEAILEAALDSGKLDLDKFDLWEQGDEYLARLQRLQESFTNLEGVRDSEYRF